MRILFLGGIFFVSLIAMWCYPYIRTTDNTIIDLCISDFPEIFAVHEGFSDKQIRKIYNWNL